MHVWPIQAHRPFSPDTAEYAKSSATSIVDGRVLVAGRSDENALFVASTESWTWPNVGSGERR